MINLTGEADEQLITKEEFEALNLTAKGYLVYMRGNWDEQPNVPKGYEPTPEELEQYNHGQRIAIIEVQDSP
ncbi:hypothetical protein LCGC14_2162170 [marine sediment metagenome]|uniref:Uncharacterized protein n=1 Tax=marine sediment metagenome TaxID=412755 RepID=A0A0F9DSB9_9ZZZZ